jgi:hypothetical protein
VDSLKKRKIEDEIQMKLLFNPQTIDQQGLSSQVNLGLEIRFGLGLGLSYDI